MRLFTRNGHDWSARFPVIAEVALRNRCQRFVIDGEAVLLGIDGRSDFNGLHSRRHDNEVQLYAFDILALEGDDLRKLPLHLARPIWPAFSPAVLTAYTWHHSSRARSARSSIATPA
ncbi:hypothetical protein [Bradyrhizobium brasilense]|uniref:ATP-dependent DNA ligase n=1 Tax=Bradyrhizobium brasilense TaxID=1419277 RepID=UPI003221AA01